MDRASFHHPGLEFGAVGTSCHHTHFPQPHHLHHYRLLSQLMLPEKLRGLHGDHPLPGQTSSFLVQNFSFLHLLQPCVWRNGEAGLISPCFGEVIPVQVSSWSTACQDCGYSTSQQLQGHSSPPVPAYSTTLSSSQQSPSLQRASPMSVCGHAEGPPQPTATDCPQSCTPHGCLGAPITGEDGGCQVSTISAGGSTHLSMTANWRPQHLF